MNRMFDLFVWYNTHTIPYTAYELFKAAFNEVSPQFTRWRARKNTKAASHTELVAERKIAVDNFLATCKAYAIIFVVMKSPTSVLRVATDDEIEAYVRKQSFFFTDQWMVIEAGQRANSQMSTSSPSTAAASAEPVPKKAKKGSIMNFLKTAKK